MKSMSNNNSTNNNNNTNNWLGVSLSPCMNMEVPSDPHNHQVQTSTSVQRGFLLSPSQLSNPGICQGVEGENGGFYSHLSVMPLKSDGSLCIMEALSRSQPEGMVSSTTPKLENFLGGATMGAHHYGSNEREAMSLSLDSMYYNHHDSEVETNRHHSHSLNLLHQSFRQQQQQQQHQIHQVQQQHNHHPYFSTLTNHEMYQAQLGNHNTTKENHLVACNPTLPQVSEDGVGGFRNWVSRNYCQVMEQKMDGGFMGGGDEGGGSGSVSAMGYGDLQSLSLSMSPGSQSSCITAPPPQQISQTGGGVGSECVVAMETTKKRGSGGKVVGQKQPVHRKSIDTFGQRTSQYRGVTRHRWTGRYEAHLWDNSCKKEGQTRKGRQGWLIGHESRKNPNGIYLGGYDMEEKAARAYDLAALKYWGPSTYINFSLENYQEELEGMKNMSRQEYVAHLRRKSSGFSRGASIYRGVTRHHQHGRWQARIGRVAGNKDLYLGTFSTQEEAAEAYDIAAIKFRGVNAVTNFDITRYDAERIMASNTLLTAEHAKRNKEIVCSNEAIDHHSSTQNSNDNSMGGGPEWKMVMYQSSPQQPTDGVETVEQKSTGIGSYLNTSFTGALHDVIELHTMNSDRQVVDEPVSLGVHLSNASSIVTSLNSSREGSPDKNGLSMLFARPTSVSSWIPSSQSRPAAGPSIPHIPMFAAWTDV